ncbi:WhiB family transcriptional regulator [Corynebacterium sp. ES2794-CONJ1]|uniref:WhiB family transcriptional regulator n=1 Tax=unclassified Corynebacterium TaxID=2624378 RepID=UPI002166F890|nr:MULTISPECIES: WhiB family transcriptional regulator [unclassified Corynebacterium]MCS4490089.1 WhiB family transcriptional regulator [Corynebacterium sp. ES2775-CONJ]MCS4492102.1 WhiB family transcriptional regulator [Corynebacterium sp. ES2715-CONJ3]MCS4532210.1 WhiB family transcriptional regulator [Corynebacterium sp. ES2730-CONJ]MCU9519606.1 WhiB family transcriptional regulator [Corynebacterium sp. ES2794-CONJ1]
MTTSLANPQNNALLDPSGLGSIDRGDWVMHANCRNEDPDALFVRGAAQRRAAAICRQCPVLLQCRVDALDNRVEFGVWGGLTERQRRALLRKNPDITSWADYIANGGELHGI